MGARQRQYHLTGTMTVQVNTTVTAVSEAVARRKAAEPGETTWWLNDEQPHAAETLKIEAVVFPEEAK